jgi:hypothetical protein
MSRRKIKRWTRPVKIEYDREVFEVLHMIRNSGKTDKEVAAEANSRFESATKTGKIITPQTIHNWRIGYAHGGTRYPAGFRLRAVAEVCGYRTAWVPAGSNEQTPVKFDGKESDIFVGKKRRK